MKTLVPLTAAFLTLSGIASAAPRLVVSTPSLTPESEIELVLDSPAVATSDLGKTVDNTWLEIQPALPGKLLWKSPTLAKFTPDQSPAIGARYTFSIPKNRKFLDQSAVPAGVFATVESEPFRIVTAEVKDRWNEDFTPSSCQWVIVFNDEVDPKSAANFISFASSSGQRVAARLEQATRETGGYQVNRSVPWSTRFPGAAKPPETTPASPVATALIATPLSPLPPGPGWQLSVLKGLPNRAAGARTLQDTTYGLGNIEPFQVKSIRADQQIDEPRAIEISFNYPVPTSLPVDFLAKCIQIEPRPENLKAEFRNRDITLTGDFADLEKCTVTFQPPFVSRAGLDLAGPFTKEITFGHFVPVLAFPSQDQAQLANGSREYRMLTANLASAHLRIKKLSGADQIRAFQGYRHVSGNGPDETSVEPTIAAIPYPLVVGEPVADLEIPLGNPLDTSKIVTLRWDEILPKNRSGIFFIDAAGKNHPDYNGAGVAPVTQSIVQLTDIGLAWKFTGKDAFIYAFSCNTGSPLPGVKIEVFGEDAVSVATATTDASGVAAVPRAEGARHLRASLGADEYLTAFDSSLDSVGLWHFPVRYSWNKTVGAKRMVFLFTDRSLYRPGETVRLKGIVRDLSGNAIGPSQTAPARIVIVDPTDTEIHSSPVTISENGSFDFSYTLPAGKVGTHAIRLEYPEDLARAEGLEEQWELQESLVANSRFELPLRVEDFRRNAFEVTQTIPAPAIGATTLSADLLAKYYQGQPVAAGTVKYFSRIATENPYPERFRDYLFGNHRVEDWKYWYHYFGYRSDDESGSAGGVTQAEGSASLTAEGKATLPLTIPQADFPTAREVTISTEVTDANNQTLTATTTATVHPASVYVGVSRIDQLVLTGKPLPLTLVAADTAGEPFPGAVKVTATLTREVNSAVKTQTDSGATTTRNDVAEETVSTTELTLDPAASAGQGTPLTLAPKSTGLHFLTVRGTDPDGKPFATVTRFHAYGTNEYPWLYEDGLRVKLVAEKKSYQPGETARVLVLSPIEGTALVTIEREKVLRSFQVPLKADKPVIEIPVTADDAPNAFVSVLIVKGAQESAREHKQPQLRLGYCELLVENQRDRLAVNFEAPPAAIRPGDEITLNGSILLAGGAPAAGAEVTLYAEDEGTLAVIGYDTPQPLEYFYKPRDLDVETGTSFHSFVPEDPEMQTFANKGFFIGGGGDMSKLADLLRKNFDPCATWAPALTTDASGKFTHTFKVPDTLTRYRIIAVAHHQATRFGQAESSVVVSKDLMLEPKTPRFAHQGDTFDAQVLVQNASQFAGTWEIRYDTARSGQTPPVTATGPFTSTLSLEPGASATVVFPSRADTTGEAVITWQATPVSLKSGKLDAALKHRLSDAVESRFHVAYPMPLLRQTKLISLKPGNPIDLRGQLDANLLGGTGSVDLEISRSPLIEAAGSIDYLLHYPYGCVEQTTSSLIPWLAVESLAPVVPRFANIPEQKVAAAIQAGADRLLSMQLPDGSFAYWPGGRESVPWATSYAGLGLMMAAEKGANVPESAVASLVKNLEESLRGLAAEKSPAALELHARSLMVLALAESPQAAYQNALVDRIAELTPGARSLLATTIAIQEDGDDAGMARAKSVLTSKVPFKSRNDGWMPWTADDAYRFIAWQLIDPDGPETTKTLDRMLRDRNPYGHWRNTWVNGWSLMALAQYAESHELDDETVNLTLGGKSIALTTDQPTLSRSLTLKPDLNLGLQSDRTAFVRVNVASKPKIAPIQPVATNGLSIDRTYERVEGDGTTTILTEPRVGDLIRVSLRVTLPKDDTRYLAIEDPLPSIFETVNNDFKSQRAAAGVATSQNDWSVSHSELRTDRAAFFLDHIWRKGTYTVTYLARCTLAGQATAPPAKVEPMYDPENFALSASRIFTAR